MVALFLALSGVILSGTHREVAQWGIEKVLAAQGLPVRSIAVTKLTTEELIISRLQIEGDLLSFDRLSATFSIDQLIDQSINSLIIQGIRTKAQIRDGVITFPFLDALPKSSAPQEPSILSIPTPFPVKHASIGGTVILQTKTEISPLSFNLNIEAEKPEIVGNLSLKSIKKGVEITGNATITPLSPNSLSFTLNSQAKTTEFVDLTDFFALPNKSILSGEITLKSQGSVDLDNFSGVITTGEVESDLIGASPPHLTSLKVGGRLAFKSDRQQITLTTRPNFSLSGQATLPSDLIREIPEALKSTLATGKLDFKLNATEPPHPAIEVTFPKTRQQARVAFNQSLSVTTESNFKAKAQANGAVILKPVSPFLDSINISDFKISSNTLKYNDLIASIPFISGDLTGSPTALSGQLTGELLGSGLLIPGHKIDQGRVNFSGNYKLNETNFAFMPQGCQKISMARSKFDSASLPDGIELCLKGNNNKPLISKSNSRITVNGIKPGTKLNLTLKTDEAPLTLQGSTPQVQLAGTFNLKTNDMVGTLSSQGGQITQPLYMLRLRGGKLDAEISIKEGKIDATGKGVGFQATSLEKLPLFTPLNLGGSATLKESQIVFNSEVNTPSQGLRLQTKGVHSLTSGKGNLSFTLQPLTFTPEGLQPKSLHPPLGGIVSSVSGLITAQGKIAWPTSPLTSSMSLTMKNMALSTDTARLEGLDLILDLNSLWPPSAAPGQTLTLALADVGVPVTQLYAEFGISYPGVVEAKIIEWPWAGGTIRTHNAQFGLTSGDTNLTLDVEDLDLEQLIPLLNLEGLNGTGLLSGKIPVVLRPKGDSIISGAKLYSQGDGVIQFKNQAGAQALGAGGGSASLLSTALEDFHYKTLKAEIEGELTGEMEIRVHLAGFNPSLYDGYPLELNLALQGGVNQLLKSGSTITDVPKNLRKQLKRPQ